jgi:fatty-acyl-CoA synthase
LSLTLQLSFNKAITLWPHRKAIVDGEKSFTYFEFGTRVNQLAQYLLSLGTDTGSVVAVLAPNCHEFMEAYYACAMLGIVLVPLNFRLAAAEIGDILKDAEASVLIVHPDFLATATTVLERETDLKHLIYISEKLPDRLSEKTNSSISSGLYEPALASQSGEFMPERDLTPDHLAQLYYTSGTTGRPKGVMLTHMNVTSNAIGAMVELQLTDATVWGHFAPIFHLADAWSLFAVTWGGGMHVFTPYFKAAQVLDQIVRNRVTMTALVPTMVNQILALPNLKSYDLSSLKWIMTAGSPVAPEQVKRIMQELHCDYCQFYGLTETSPFLTVGTIKDHLKDLPAERLVEVKARTGRAFLAVDVKVVREDGSEVRRDNTEVGEIIARGPNVTKGYWKQPETTAQAIRNGWFHTGDLAVIDTEGYINIVDRQKDMIITGGENVYSTEVEYALYEHPAVLECAVFGIPDEKWGEIVKAVIVLKTGHSTTEEELVAHTKSKLAGYKTPRSIDFATELPKTGSGKIFKKGLRDSHWTSSSRKV